MAGDKVRTFLALPTPGPLKERFAELARELAPLVPGIRFVRPEGVHLTLRFLGWATTEQVVAVAERVRPAAASCPRGIAPTTGLGFFPERGAPRVLFVGFRLPEPVLALQRECEAAACAAGLPPEERPFRPHLTLGRFKDRARRVALPAVAAGAMPIEEVVLYQSELKPGGAVYTPLEAMPLGRSS
jgi:2'-5' RNA ligase